MTDQFYKKSFKLGSLTLPNNIIYAPLAGCSDFPFRQMASRYHSGLKYCEMVKMDGLIRYDRNTFRLLDYSIDMHPIGAQLCGSNPKIAGQAARMIEDMGFDVLDLNCGCPVDKVTKDGSGSAMLKNPERIGEVISEMVAAVKIPVTVKIRAGWDEESLCAPQITQIAESAGAQAICIHGRTRVQAYKGNANWGWIRQCKEVAKEIKVIGNGDLFDPESVEKMAEITGADAALIARGTMGNPWIAQDIARYFQDGVKQEYSNEERREALLEHFRMMMEYLPERKAVVEVRKVGCWYLKKSAGTREFRGKISRAETAQEVFDLITEFPLGDELEKVSNQIDEC